MTAFNKPALTVQDQLALLQSRGLVVSDPAYALRRLRHIGFYRLSAYMLPFQNGGAGQARHQFVAGTTIEQVVDLYVFDRKLRLLFMDAIERVEVSVRAALSGAIAVANGPHWFADSTFFSGINHEKYLAEIGKQIDKSTDVFIDHYYTKYTGGPAWPPSWMMFECMSFGTVSLTVKGIAHPHANQLAQDYGLPQQVLASWLHAMSYVRNLCAHHSRLWNRNFIIRPMVANRFRAEMTPNDKLYAQALVVLVLARAVIPDFDWARRLATLFDEYSTVPTGRMGFPVDWRSRAPWKAALT